MKFDTKCKLYLDKDIVEAFKIEHFDEDTWMKNKYYKVQCGMKIQGSYHLYQKYVKFIFYILDIYIYIYIYM